MPIGVRRLTGCGDGQARVSGTVKFDGQPVSTGASCSSRGTAARARAASSRTASSRRRLPPGRYKIEVRATKVTGKRTQKGFDGKDEEIELTDEMIPDRYNTKTELVEELKSGSNTVNST